MTVIAIVEDNPKFTETLKDLLKSFQEEYAIPLEISCYVNGKSFLDDRSSEHDIVLMDIDMPLMNGLETAKIYRADHKNPVLIFITELAQYAIKGYEVDAMDYMVKPVNYEALKMRLLRAIEISEKRKPQKINLKVNNGLKIIDISEIYYIEVIKHQLVYYTTHGNYTVWGTMTEAENNLGKAGFSRCNSCYLVNIKYVSAIQDDYVFVNGENLKISRAKKKEFINTIMEYMQGMRY